MIIKYKQEEERKGDYLKRKTTDEYKLELEILNKKQITNIRLKDGVEYINARTKITHICTCGREWDIKPNSILTGNAKSCDLCHPFSQWCIENNRQDILDRWDYDLNNCKPSEITFSTNIKYYFKCPRGIHNSELKNISNFTNGQEGSIKCNQCNSFAQWGIDHIGEDFLEKYWDYDKNTVSPWEISKATHELKVWIKCQEKDYHESYDINCFSFVNGSRCGYCKGDRIIHLKDSFAQYLINLYGENALELYWDYKKNTVDPWEIREKSQKTVYIYCQEKDYHDSYPTLPSYFITGCRCPYCINHKVHLLDSLGTLYPQVLNIWSDKNDKSPYEYAPMSNQWVWWKCTNNKHKDYYRKITESQDANFRCPSCSYEQKESIMATTLKQVLKHEYSDTKWEYDVGFRTSKNWASKYDIFVTQLDNLLIECQSEYHDDPKQQELDKLKKEYALNNGYNYLALDKRDYTPLEAIQIFFPEIKEVPDYVDISKNTLRDWDLEKAQKLLNEGYTYQEVANMVGTTYSALNGFIKRKILIKPENYKKVRLDRQIKIVCLDIKNNKLVKLYNSLTEAAIDMGNKNCISTICMALKKMYNTAYGYKWMYYNDYIQLNNNLNT